eukprot:11535935-Alexandrium_andersonii.AAC.1
MRCAQRLPLKRPLGGPQFEARTPHGPPVLHTGPPVWRTEPPVLRTGPLRGAVRNTGSSARHTGGP